MSKPSRQQIPIAVVGVSTLFPGSTDSRGFWDDILAGKDLITEVPASHWLIEDYYDPDPKAMDKTYAKRGGFLPTVDFDPLEFGVPPNIVPATDSAQILALIVAQKVLDDAAQGQFAHMDRDRISVLLGVTSAQELLGNMVSRLQKPVWLKALRESGVPEAEAQDICLRIANSYTPWQESSFPGLLGNVVAGRIANRFDLRGTNAVTDAACASSLAAVSMGINELQIGQSDLVITGGVDAMNDIFMYMCFSKTPALSPTGDCRPFSDAADGTMLGEGIAMMALKRLEDAERDGDRVYAVIRGVGSASDGRANSVYAPLPAGQARSLTRAYEVAGFGPETVELVEAHGTGTKAGDAAEFAGLKLAFAGAREDTQWCALGSVKSQIGHAKASAGAAGLFKAIMALHHKVLPPTIKVDRPNPKLEIENSPFYLNTQRRPWIRDAAHPRRASVSSFGFGGSNFHVTLEEYVPSVPSGRSAWRLRTVPSELVLLGAATPAALIAQCRALAGTRKALSHVARESQLAFSATADARLAVVAATADELAQKLTQAAASIEKAPTTAYSSPSGVHYAVGAADAGRLAFLFPGQGSQYVGMGADVAMAFDVARQAWDAAANLPFDGVRLHDVVFPKPVFSEADREAQQQRLTATEWAQPALGVHSQSLARVLHLLGVRPDCVAGHSFGEVSALHEAGVLDAASLVKVARRRGELMRDAAAVPGAMTAVVGTLEDVRAVVAASGAGVVVANHNAPTQVVLSGAVDDIAQVEAAVRARGMTAKRLPVATAFHSPLVAGCSVPFAEFLQDVAFDAPALPVYSNATAAGYATEPAEIRSQLAAQLAQPVRFVEQIEALYADGVRTFVEVGAGSVLTELVGRILGERPHRAISLDRKGKHGVTTLQDGLGRLALAGVAMDFAPLWAPFAPPSEQPVKKPAMTMPICGANPGRPYPPPGGAKDLPPPNPPRALPVAPEPIIIRETVVVHEPSPIAAPEATAMPAASLAQAQPQPTPPVPVASDAQLAWVQAFQETQRQTAEAHAAYQRAMADSHMAFLKTAESSYLGLGALLGSVPEQQAWAPAPASAAPAVAAVSAIAVAPPAPVVHPAPVAQPLMAPPPVPAPLAAVPAPVVATVAPSAPAAVAAPAASVAPSIDLEALMMAIVAEKTGYPQEMLGLQMELEADLGIDSIKRVEILSAIRDRAPELPEVKSTELAGLRTLGQIVEHLRAAGGAGVPAPVVAAVAPSAPAAVAAPATPSIDLEALMMAIVAEKTGYPQEMLGLQMELEADLGIDSIKRVEILSAIRDRAPELPEVKSTELAGLRTLGQIVDHLRAAGGAGVPAAVAKSALAAVAAPAAPATPSIDLEALMMAIVAEKTGYPQEMLGLQMELEADLGIDSIKRVEILSAIRDRAPELPEVKSTELAGLRTLGQIVEYLRAAGGAAMPAPVVATVAPSAPAAVAAPAASATPSVDLEALMMAIVAEKTGYPQEMLGLQMELEADLGIDSIKRVEILSAIRDRAPELPEVKSTELAGLRTLGQIVEHLRAAGGTTAGHAAPATVPDAVPAEVARFAVREVAASPVGMALAGLHGAQRLVVTDEGSGVAAALVAGLVAHGVRASVVDGVPADADGVIFLGGLRAVESVDDAVAVNREAFRASRTVAARLTAQGGVWVSVQDTGGDFGLSGRDATRAYLGGVSALTRTAALEWPAASVKAIDLERGTRSADEVAEAILAELLQGGSTLEVGLHADGRRSTLASVATATPVAVADNLDKRSVLVASGGGRGVTAAALIALARARQPRMVLLGRTALADEPGALRGIADEAGLKRALLQSAQAQGLKPTPADLQAQLSTLLALREIRATLEALRAAGSEARYLAVDVADADALGAALDGVRKDWGPITALVHGAGVLADKRIEEKTDAQFDRVFDTKVSGLRALLAATADDPLTALCLFSSVAARTGNLGQCDYAMANEVLNLVACAEQARRGAGCVVRAIGWGPWDGGMVTPGLKRHFEQMGVALIPLAAGAQCFVDELSCRSDATRIVIGGAQGEGALGARVTPQATVEVQVSRTSHPHLADHAIAGVPVLPMVLAVEWFLRAALACRPDLLASVVKQVKVLRGIKLTQFAGAGDGFVLRARQLSEDAGVAEIAVELRGKGDVLHYSATVRMTAQPVAAPALAAAPTLQAWTQPEVYDGQVLFHGPRFQVIRAVQGVSREGIVGTLTGNHEAGWPAEAWCSDVAALDGGLQLALLWSRQVLGGAVLPMALGEYRSYHGGLTSGPLTAVVRGRRVQESRAVCEVALVDAAGQVVAELMGVETVLRPDVSPVLATRAA
ncbi:MAG: SDR family oxidoreductase [Xanthomonadales bacterium]|jgi:malonyl CoA-acyl carrier protein transacylase|nr:SDR family oxidoreductase [Xanthomonadales bacterium]